MCVYLSARTVPIMSSPTVEPLAGPFRALTLRGLSGLSGLSTKEVILGAPGPRGQHRARGAEENNIEGARPSLEVPGLTQANLKHLEGKDPVAAALGSVVSSLPPLQTVPITAFEEMANAEAKAGRKAVRKGKGKEAAMGPMFGTTGGDDTFEIPYGKCGASASRRSSAWEPD